METYLKFTIDVDNCKKNLYDRYTDLKSILTLAKYRTSYIWQFIDWSVRNFISMLRPGYGLSSNPRIDIKSRALYHSVGFQEISSRKGYYPTRDGREDAIVMQKLLGN